MLKSYLMLSVRKGLKNTEGSSGTSTTTLESSVAVISLVVVVVFYYVTIPAILTYGCYSLRSTHSRKFFF